MDRDRLLDLLFEKGRNNNISQMEAYILKESSMNINIYEGQLEKYIVSEEESLSIRGIYNEKMGYSYTEKLLPESLDEIINNLIQYAENNENEEIENISSSVEINREYKEKVNFLEKYSEEENR